jgi:hypothetical protein
LSRYSSTWKQVYTQFPSAEETSLRNEAEAIDAALGGELEKDYKQGARSFMSAHGKTAVMIEKSEERIRLDLDPTGNVRQFQSPLEVGQSTNILSRMSSHDPRSGLGTATKTWSLLLSCLKTMKVTFNVVTTPIMLIWKSEQLNQAEILITLLGGSLVEDGGYNVKQAGTAPLPTNRRGYMVEMREVFEKHDWLKDNLEASMKVIEDRIHVLEVLKGVSDGSRLTTIKEELKIMQEEVEEFRKSVPSVSDLERNMIIAIEDETALIDDINERIQLNHDHFTFQNAIDDWLNDS